MNRTAICLVMLLLAALPDAMFAPVLKTILVDRYGVGEEATFWFMSVNLLGIILVLPVLPWLRRRIAPATLIAIAAICNGILYGVMALPIGLVGTLWVRGFEGAPDLVALAAVLSLVSRGNESPQDDNRSLRFGLAGTTMMLGLFLGLLIGGLASGGGANVIFSIAAGECLLLAVVALAMSGSLPATVRAAPRLDDPVAARRYPVWPSMLFMFTDRGLGAALTVAGALYMQSILDLSPRLVSSLLAMTILLLAICNGPLGFLADRFGALRIRVIAAAGYGLCFMGLALSNVMPMGWLIAMMCLMGLAGAGLFPTALSLGARHGGGATDMGLLQAAGQWGFFAASALGGLVLHLKSGEEPLSPSSWTILFVAYAAVYLVLNVVGVLGICWRRLRPAPQR